MVIWIVGMSGAGKTAIGRELYQIRKKTNPATVLIDGDEIREIFKNDKFNKDYTVEGRRKNADRIREMCVWLDRQGIDVVCCILSIFEENHQWNRENFDQYFEVYVSAEFEDLVERNPKDLYLSAQKGIIDNVVGVDIEFKAPEKPDLQLTNNRPYKDPVAMANQIQEAIQKKFA